MKIALHLPLLFVNQGGMEKLGSDLANWLVSQGHDVAITCYPTQSRRNSTYPLRPEVKKLVINRDCDTELNPQILKDAGVDVFCSLSSNPDVLTPFRACVRGGIPFVYSEHNYPGIIENERWNRAERLAVCLGANAVHLLLDSYRNSLPDFLQAKIRVIPNAVVLPEHVTPFGQREKVVITAARLVDTSKQLSHLIRAFSAVSSKYPDWSLLICGEGPARPYYEDLVATHGLAGRVLMPGNVDDMPVRYAGASVFCLPSRHEGCPISLLEALSHGLPSVGYAACPGVGEIIIDGVNGLLASKMSYTSLATVLDALLGDDALREKLAGGARAGMQAYSMEKFFANWLNMLERAAEEGPAGKKLLDGLGEREIALGVLIRLAAPGEAERKTPKPQAGFAPDVRQKLRERFRKNQ